MVFVFKYLWISHLQVEKQHEEAERLCNEALAVYEQVLGKDHPSTLASMEKLAAVLHVC